MIIIDKFKELMLITLNVEHPIKDKNILINDVEIGQNELNVTFPHSYKLFMENYGHSFFDGFIINGVYSTDSSIVKQTKYYQKFGLPNEYVVIEVDGTDWIYCLDTKNMVDNECPVVEWSIGEVEGMVAASNFYEFLKEQISEYYYN